MSAQALSSRSRRKTPWVPWYVPMARTTGSPSRNAGTAGIALVMFVCPWCAHARVAPNEVVVEPIRAETRREPVGRRTISPANDRRRSIDVARSGLPNLWGGQSWPGDRLPWRSDKAARHRGVPRIVLPVGPEWCTMGRNGVRNMRVRRGSFLTNEATKTFGIIASEKSKAIWRRCGRWRRAGIGAAEPVSARDVARSCIMCRVRCGNFMPDVRIAWKRREFSLLNSTGCLF